MKKTFKTNVNGLQGLDLTGMQIMQNEHGNVMLVIFNAKAYGTNDMGSNQLHAFLQALVNGTCTVQPKTRLSAKQREFIQANCPSVLEQHDKAWKSKKQQKRTSKNRVVKDSSRIDKTFGELSEEEKQLEAHRELLRKDYQQQIKDSIRVNKNSDSLIRYMNCLNYSKHDVIEELTMEYYGNVQMMARDYAENVLNNCSIEQVEYQLRGLLGV